MSPSIWQILIVIVLIVLLFGRNKISDLMGDVARGIRSFKKGLNDEPESSEPPKAVTAQKSDAASESKSEEKTEA